MLSVNGHRDDVVVAGATVIVGTVTVVAANRTDKTGPILAFVGAIIVALLTAYTADRRQRAQLVAERERLEDRLAHERRLKGIELVHDRRLQDVQHLRDFLDEAVEAFETFVAATLGFEVALERRDEADAVVLAEIDRAEKAALKAKLDADVAIRRMFLRVAPDHDLVRQFRAAVESVNEGLRRYIAAREVIPVAMREMERAIRQGGDSFVAFSETAQAFIGAAGLAPSEVQAAR